MYDGEWLNDMYHGKGTEQWKYNQIKYTGDFVNSQKTGKGKFEFDGNVYEGDFVDGQFHGQGKYYFAESGKKYEGEFVENNIQGKGTMTWPDQSTYNGDFIDGKADGFGVKKFADGSIYEGEWKQDMRHTVDQESKYFNGKTKKQTENFWKNDKEIFEAAPQESPWRHMRKVNKLTGGIAGIKHQRITGSKALEGVFRLIPEHNKEANLDIYNQEEKGA